MPPFSRRAAAGLLAGGLLAVAAPAGAKIIRSPWTKGRVVDVADGKGLAAALAGAAPGDRIRLVGGA